jgi:hypothetical protein
MLRRIQGVRRKDLDRVIPRAVLAAGLGAALLIYLSARSPAADPLGNPEDSKRYLREMQVYGGSANVLATELREWFDSLWHGERLAFTVAVLTLLLAAGYWFAVTHLRMPPEEATGEGDGPGAGGT